MKADTNPKIPITVIVPIKNEAANLSECLKRLERFEEVVVVDSGSTDGSADIARQHGATVLDFHWDGHFPKKRNWVLNTYSFRTAWVLFLDADEQITQEFIAEAAKVINQSHVHGFWVTYPTYFMGQLLHHGDKLDKLSLLRLGHGEYERIDEDHWSSLDMEVHEKIVVDGAVGKIQNPIPHNDFKGLESYYAKHNHYSTWESSRFISLLDSNKPLERRQMLKYRLLGSSWFPPLYFLGAYIIKGGFLDGKAGFRFAIGKMFYFYQINFKIKEKMQKWDMDKGEPKR
jgi:glycosyltransferase involved in cell wall biosynthesis